MSHQFYAPARPRLQRSELAVPGSSPKGRVMGHAGAIVSAYGESAVEKVELLKECGVTISKNPSIMGETVKSALNGKKN